MRQLSVYGKEKCTDDCTTNTDMYYIGGAAKKTQFISTRNGQGVSRSSMSPDDRKDLLATPDVDTPWHPC
jgi:hypothetical protein